MEPTEPCHAIRWRKWWWIRKLWDRFQFLFSFFEMQQWQQFINWKEVHLVPSRSLMLSNLAYFFAIFKALSKCQNILNPTRFGLRYPSMPAGMASNPWHWQGSSPKVQTKLSRNRWQEHWNLESGSSNHVSLNSWFSYYTDFVCLNKYQGHQVHSAPAAASVLAFLQKTYFGIAETLPHEWGP